MRSMPTSARDAGFPSRRVAIRDGFRDVLLRYPLSAGYYVFAVLMLFGQPGFLAGAAGTAAAIILNVPRAHRSHG
jgi:hypothetical protein